jgi:hypothetical protein
MLEPHEAVAARVDFLPADREPWDSSADRDALDPDDDTVVVAERIFLTADRGRAVPAGHPDAHVLLVGAGGRLPRAVAERFGLTRPVGELGEPEPDELDKLTPKQLRQLAAELDIELDPSLRDPDELAPALRAAIGNHAPGRLGDS